MDGGERIKAKTYWQLEAQANCLAAVATSPQVSKEKHQGTVHLEKSYISIRCKAIKSTMLSVSLIKKKPS